MNIQLYTKLAIHEGCSTYIYGQHNTCPWTELKISNVCINSQDMTSKSSIVTQVDTLPPGSKARAGRSIFVVKILSKLSSGDSLNLKINNTEYSDIAVTVINADDSVDTNNYSTVISTMVQNEHGRLDEWVKYHLAIGVNKIILFDNDFCVRTDKWSSCKPEHSVSVLCDKYPGKVERVAFPYGRLTGTHKYFCQQATLTMGYHFLKNNCKHICFIDVDEFIYTPNTSSMNIDEKLKNYDQSIIMGSHFLINDPSEGKIFPNNDVLQHVTKQAKKTGYTKMIINTQQSLEHGIDFIVTPHKIPSGKTGPMSHTVPPLEDLLHYHCWLNRHKQAGGVECDNNNLYKYTHE